MQPVVVNWPGGEHAFRLAIGEMKVLQEKTDCGPEYLMMKLSAGRWTADELFEVIRNGLIGGGMPHVEALKLVRREFDAHPFIEFKAPCIEILASALYGPPIEDETPGEADPVMPTPEDQKTESSVSP